MDSTKKKFLFVNKSVGSKHLGHSSGYQKRLIFSHAQLGMKALRTQHVQIPGTDITLCQCNSDLDHARVHVHYRKHTAICGTCQRPIREEGLGNLFDVSRSCGSKPKVIPPAPDTFSWKIERTAGEAFQFFTTRTAVEWSGWNDAEFWQVYARQMSASYPSVQHALVSLGAFHLSLEQADVSQMHAWRSVSLRYARRMLQTLVAHHSIVPAYVLILLLVVTTEVSALLHDTTWLQAAQVEFNFMSSLRKRRACVQNWNFIAEHVESTVEKRRSRYAQKIDMVWSLRIAHPTQFDSKFELKAISFASLDEAQASLKLLLNQVTHEVKTSNLVCGTLSVEAENMICRWYRALEAWEDVMDRSEIERCQSSLLKVSANFGMLMIKTMYAVDELVFDQFESDYLLLLETYTKVVHLCRSTRRASATFATSSNLLCLMSNTVLRWCRHPAIRRKLILLLFEDGRQEGHDVSFGWARLADRIQSIEEEGLIEPPTEAQDIPARNRICLDRMTFYKDSYWMQMSYFRHPWREEDRETIWHSWIDTDDTIQLLDDTKSLCLKRQLNPIITLGRGRAECFDVMTGVKALDICDAKFYFPILRL